MTVRFACVTPIAAPPEIVFDLSLDVDEHVRSMARSGERAVTRRGTGITSGHIGLDEEVTWKARHFGVPFRMTSRVVELHRPTRFVDEQVRGPFRRFHHEHRFEGTGTGTRMIDTISFDAPFGPLGRVTEQLLLGRYLRDLIAQRNEHLRVVAERAAGAAASLAAP
jgi:ligand-binding SRPBCC domain-containing protein